MYKKTTTTVEEYFDAAQPQMNSPMLPPTRNTRSPMQPTPIIHIDPPLLMKVLGYTRDEGLTNESIRYMVDEMTALCASGEVLNVEDYDYIVEEMASQAVIVGPASAKPTTP